MGDWGTRVGTWVEGLGGWWWVWGSSYHEILDATSQLWGCWEGLFWFIREGKVWVFGESALRDEDRVQVHFRGVGEV